MPRDLAELERRLLLLEQQVLNNPVLRGDGGDGTDGENADWLADVPEMLGDGGDFDDYAWRGQITGDLEIMIRAGNAYMVNEAAVAYADRTFSVPETDGTYVVYLRHNYGYGATPGTWESAPVLCASSAVPSEMSGGRVVARNFIIFTVVVAGGRIDSRNQNWRWGDVQGYAPYFRPSEGPPPA